MAVQNSPNSAAGRHKAGGERWSSEQNTVRNVDRDENPERLYDDRDDDDAGGITNRPLSEEVDNQESLPGRGDPDDADPAMPADDSTLTTKI
jgi:hypothetical protein